MSVIDAFVAKTIDLGPYTELDATYLFNRVLALVGEAGDHSSSQSLRSHVLAIRERH